MLTWAGIPIHFAIATYQLLEKLRKNVERLFEGILAADVGQFLSNSTILGISYRWELASVLEELKSHNITLEPELNAGVEFLRGRDKYTHNQIETALAHYQQSLNFFQRNNNLERCGIVLLHLGLCCLRRAELEATVKQECWQEARSYFQQAIDRFESAKRIDLVAKFINQLGEVLRQLNAWDDLRILAQKAVGLHQIAPTTLGGENDEQRYRIPLEVLSSLSNFGKEHSVETSPVPPRIGGVEGRTQLAQAYGFLAEVALEQFNNWVEANRLAQQALSILSEVPIQQQRHAGLYQLLLARSHKHLGQMQDAIQTLETARTQSKPQDNPQIYIQILKELRELYFNKCRYLEAFQIKQEQGEIEATFGLRAFIGASRLQPKREIKSTLTDIEHQEAVAPEIAASGRQFDVKRLIERMTRDDCKLTVIHGESGVGKSSILMAGLVPTLRQEPLGIREALPIIVRVYTNWMGELEKCLTEELTNVSALGVKYAASLSDSGTIELILAELRRNENRNLVTIVIFDQFEEFFFVYTQPQQRRQFFEFIRDCLNTPYVKVILSLREDYLHYLLECERFVNLGIIGSLDILNRDNRYYLGNFSEEDTRLIIQTLTQRAQFNLESQLIDELIRDLTRELNSVRPIELQVVGAQLQTDNITTLEQYRELGPKERLVERYLEEVIRDCGEENQKAAQLVLYLLTDVNGTRPLKTRAELTESLAAQADKLDLVLDIFVKSGLLVLIPETPADRYQLVHDYLVAFIRQQQGEDLLVELAESRKREEQSQAEILQLRKEKKLLEALTKEQQKRKFTEEQLERAEQLLIEAKHKAKQQIRIGWFGLVSSFVLAISVSLWAFSAFKTAQQGVRLEQEGIEALRQFESEELDALLSAMRTGQELKTRVGKNRSLKDYPALSPVWVLQSILDKIHERNQLQGHLGKVKSVSFSPDGQRIATSGEDGTVRLWNRSGKQLTQFDTQQGEAATVSFSPDGQHLATAGADGTARLWNLSGKQLIQFKGHHKKLTSLSFSPDGKYLVTASEDGTARLWNLSGEPLTQFKGHTESVWNTSFSPNSQRVVTAGEDGKVRVWDLSGKQLIELTHNGPVSTLSFSPDGQSLVTVTGLDGTVGLWNLSGQLLNQWKGSRDIILNVSFSPNGKQIATAGVDGTARVWDLSGQQLAQLKGHQNWIYSVRFSPDGQTLATAGADGSARLWDLSPALGTHRQQVAQWQGSRDEIWSVNFSPDGRTLATAGKDGTGKLWDLSGQLLAQFQGHQGGINCISFSPDGQQIATAGQDGVVRLWNRSGKLLVEMKDHHQPVYSISFSPDGKSLASTGKDGMIRLWDLTGKMLTQFKGYEQSAWSISFSPDGQSLATAGRDGPVQVWNLFGQQLAKFNTRQNGVFSVSFSPDGQRLVTAGIDTTVRVWTLDGQEMTRFSTHQGGLLSAKFSPDGQLLATAGQNGTAQIRLVSGLQIAQLSGHQGRVYSVSFSPKGQYLATVGRDGMVRLWRVEGLDALLRRGCNWLHDYLKTHPDTSITCPHP